MTKPNIIFSGYAHVDEGEFATLEIEVGIEDLRWPSPTLVFKWSGENIHDLTDPNNWYGGEMSMIIKSASTINRMASLARRICDKDDYQLGLDSVLAKLEKIGTEVCYDSRTGEYVPLGDLLPIEYKKWVDRPSYPMRGTVAITSDEASQQMIIEATEEKRFDWIRNFIASGREVFLQTHQFNGEMTTPLRDRIENPPKHTIE